MPRAPTRRARDDASPAGRGASPAPIRQSRPTKACAPIVAPSSTIAPPSTTANGPIETSAPIWSSASIVRLGGRHGPGAGRARAAHHCVRLERSKGTDRRRRCPYRGFDGRTAKARRDDDAAGAGCGELLVVARIRQEAIIEASAVCSGPDASIRIEAVADQFSAGEAHPVSLQHLLEGKELNRANFIVDRSAHDAHRRARDRICAAAPRHRHSGDLRACCGTSSRTAGRTRNSSSSASTAWTTSARKSRNGRPRRSSASPACRARSSSASPRCSRREKPATLIWCMGADPAHRRHRQRARVLHRAARHRQCRRARHRRQHLPRPHQRAGRDRPRPRYRDAAALLRPGRRRLEALVARLGGRLRLAASRFDKSTGPDGKQATRWTRRASRSTRWFDATLLPKDRTSAEGQRQGDVRHGPRRQHRDAHAARR